MKPRPSRVSPLVFAIVAGMAAAGCSSIAPLTQRISARQFVDARYFPKDEVTVHAAARAALEAMDYAFARGSRADGSLEMMSRVQPGGAALNPRQRQAIVSVLPTDTGGSHLRIGFMETSEDVTSGRTVAVSNRVLREPALYQAFWERLAEQLGLPKPPPRPLGIDLEKP